MMHIVNVSNKFRSLLKNNNWWVSFWNTGEFQFIHYIFMLFERDSKYGNQETNAMCISHIPIWIGTVQF